MPHAEVPPMRSDAMPTQGRTPVMSRVMSRFFSQLSQAALRAPATARAGR